MISWPKLYLPTIFILPDLLYKAANPSMFVYAKVLHYILHPHWRDVLISPVHLLYCQWLICVEAFLHNFTLIKEMLPDNCNMSLTSQLCGEFGRSLVKSHHSHLNITQAVMDVTHVRQAQINNHTRTSGMWHSKISCTLIFAL